MRTSTSPVTLVVADTRFICGPGVPDDGYYTATGAPYTMPVAAGVKVVLLTGSAAASLQQITATLADLQALVAARHETDNGKYGWYGPIFGVDPDARGQVTEIDEYYHP